LHLRNFIIYSGMSSSCLVNNEDTFNDEEISRLSLEIELLKQELNKKTELLKTKQVPAIIVF
jgi:hypothetical protein